MLICSSRGQDPSLARLATKITGWVWRPKRAKTVSGMRSVAGWRQPTSRTCGIWGFSFWGSWSEPRPNIEATGIALLVTFGIGAVLWSCCWAADPTISLADFRDGPVTSIFSKYCEWYTPDHLSGKQPAASPCCSPKHSPIWISYACGQREDKGLQNGVQRTPQWWQQAEFSR